MKHAILTAVFLTWLISPVAIKPVSAQTHDDHAHEKSHKQHDETEDHDDHDDHEEGKTEITPEAAQQAGVIVEKAGASIIADIVELTGRITINQNTGAAVRARFPGIVRSVRVNLGEKVEKGQVLAVVEANESLRDYNVTAPVSGVVLERNTNIGDVVNGAPLFVIADLSSVWAKLHIFPKDADNVKAGQRVRVHTLDEGKHSTAAIDMLFPTVDAPSQTFIAISILPNENGQWRPGMTVEGDVSVLQKQVPVAVRTSALQTMEGRTVVFVREDNSYEMTPVITGLSDGTHTEIKSGLSAGQEYVSEGSFIIKADILKSGAAHEH